MSKIFLCGHGNYAPADGWAKVPANSTITFFTPHAKLLKGGDSSLTATRAGRFKILAADATLEPDSVIRAFHTCPNLRLYPHNPTVVSECDAVKQAGTTIYYSTSRQGELLSEIFAKLPAADFVWVACRAVVLDKAGGDQYGVNLVQEPDGSYSRYNYQAWRYETVIQKK